MVVRALVVAGAMFVGECAGQGVLYAAYNPHTVWGGGTFSGFGGLGTKGMGDLDGDGRGDFGVIVPRALSTNPLAGGQVVAFSGSSGNVIHSLFGVSLHLFAVGGFDAGRDCDGDGVPDFAVAAIEGTSGPGRVRLFSGATGATVRDFSGVNLDDLFGQAVALVDCNGDGFADVVGATIDHQIGGTGGPRTPQIGVQSGRDGTLLWRVTGFGGRHAIAIGDANDDGCEDIVTGGGILSGADGSMIRRWSYGINALFSDLTRAGDVDGDGIEDFLVSDPSYTGSFSQQGYVALVSGGTGAVLRTHLGVQAGDGLGSGMSGGFHADNDGVPDYALRANKTVFWTPNSGRIDIYSGVTGTVIQRWNTPPQENAGGIAAVGDTDGDGTEELVFGSPFNDTSCAGCGCAYVYQVRQGPIGNIRTYGRGCPGSNLKLPTAAATGEPRLGHTLTLRLRAAANNTIVLTAVGIPTTLDLGPAGAPGCWAHITPIWWTTAATDSVGRATLPIPIPNAPALNGLRIDNQWISVDAGANQLGVTTSTAVAVVLGS